MSIFRVMATPAAEDMIALIRQANALAEMAAHDADYAFAESELALLHRLSQGLWRYHIMVEDAARRLGEHRFEQDSRNLARKIHAPKLNSAKKWKRH